MRGIAGATVIKTKYGTYVVHIEAINQKSYEKLVRKLRLIGIFVKVKDV